MPPAARVAILSPAWDFLFLGPGMTLLVSALFLGLWGAGQTAAAVAMATTLSLLVLGPHYAATYRRAYGARDIIRAHPLVTLAAPAVLAAGAALAVASPARFGPFYFLAYVAWSGYHYSGQSLGLTMLYPLRQGERLTVREKRLMALPLYVSWLLSLVGLLRAGSAARNPAYQIVRDTFTAAHLPGWALGVALGALAVSFAGVAVVARERRARGVPLPAASYGVIAAQVIWFGCGLFFPFFNVVMVPIFHSVQYLALTSWHHQRAGAGAGARASASANAGNARRFASWALAVAAIGLVINPGLIFLFVPAGVSARALVVAAAVISFVNLHHFLLDGRIWRLRERPVVQSMLA